MEDTYIKGLLDKYWQAETSLEEESALKEYFRGDHVAPELEMYKPVFAFFDQGIRLPAGLQERVLEKISPAPVRNLYRRGWWYAVAAVLVVSLAINLTPRSDVQQAPAVAEASVVADTYQDPALALAAVQNALRTVSARMNKGTEITASRMDRLTTNYRLAFKN
jgi:hypothetical protein